MERTEIVKTAEFLLAERSSNGRFSCIPFYEIEEMFGIKRDPFQHALAILQKIDAINYEIIPWNPDEDYEKHDAISKTTNTPRKKTESEIKHHLNDEGVFFSKINVEKLTAIIASSDTMIPNAVLETEKFYSAPAFDAKNGVIAFEDTECQIPMSTDEFYICKTIFSVPIGNPIDEQYILEAIDKFAEKRGNSLGNRKVYDGIRRINSRVKQATNDRLSRLIEMKGNKVRIKREQFS